MLFFLGPLCSSLPIEVRLQCSTSSDIHGPTVECSSEGEGSGHIHWDRGHSYVDILYVFCIFMRI